MKFSLGLAAALFLPVLVSAGIPPSNSTHINVQVAPGGQLVYNPSNFAAKIGTTVTFFFPKSSTPHSVTQGSFDKPCVYLAASGGNPAGFDSGLQSGKNFTLKITNDKEPIFFFCKTSFHCGLGMVGAINAPATGQTYAAYLAAAKALGSNEKPINDNGPVTGGVGAVATATPVAISSKSKASSSSKSSASSSSKSSISSSSKSSAPSSSKPSAPSSSQPSVPSSSKPSASSSSKPSASSSSKPSAPSSSQPSVPSSSKPSASSSSKPSAPSSSQPSVPSSSKSEASSPSKSAPPNTSQSKAPDTSLSKATDTPRSKATDTPRSKATETPRSKAPDTPEPSSSSSLSYPLSDDWLTLLTTAL